MKLTKKNVQKLIEDYWNTDMSNLQKKRPTKGCTQ